MTQYDPLLYLKRLVDAGVPKEQAAVHASVLGEVLSTVVFAGQMKENSRQIRRDMENMEARLVARIELLRTEIHARIDTLEASLRGEIKKLHWMFGTLVVMNIAIIAKLFFS